MSEILVLWLLFTVIPTLGALMFPIVLFSIIGGIFIAVFAAIGHFDGDEKANNAVRKIKESIFCKPFLIPFSFIFMLSLLSPSESQMKYIIGGYFAYNSAQYIGDVKGVEKLPENIVNAVNSYLEEAKK